MANRRSLAAVVALGVLACAGSAQAHHSGAMFDNTKTVTMTGTVRQFLFTNPHCYIQLMVPDQRGREVEWSLEMTAPVHLQRLGWTRSSLKPGDRVTVDIHPLRDGTNGGEVETAKMADGRPIGRRA